MGKNAPVIYKLTYEDKNRIGEDRVMKRRRKIPLLVTT
jgi:hypothetical protein